MVLEVTESWIKEYLEPRYPELVAPYREAERIREAALKSGHLSESSLSLLLESARSARTPLGENVSGMLGSLADRFPLVRDAVRMMARDKKAHVRINALVALDSQQKSPLNDEILSGALRDRSARIRALAADKIMTFGLRYLLSELEEAIAREAKPELRATLAWERDLLRDGFRIVDTGDGRVNVTCRTGGGVTSTSFSKNEMKTKGRQWIKENAVPGSD
ncbi:MAG: hypothetical protein QOF74_3715 [Caballeronia mineralivorans]|nr:hypothetical protein [Caballeronia mineralivorans]